MKYDLLNKKNRKCSYCNKKGGCWGKYDVTKHLTNHGRVTRYKFVYLCDDCQLIKDI